LENRADGIVFGYLLPDNTIDAKRTKETTALIHSYGKEAVFHKAFDLCPDYDEASRLLIDCGVDRVLTACGPDIQNGLLILKELNERYGSKLAYLPGGGVTADNIRHILDVSGCRQIHMSAKQSYGDNGAYTAVDDATLKKFLSQI
jgi:copper homeostasis protein